MVRQVVGGTEQQVECVRIEGEFPAGVSIYDFEFKPGWKIDFKKDDKGKIIGAVWTGKMAPYEFVEFGMLGLNAKESSDLVWKFVQYYDDGTKEEFTGPVGSRLPSPATTSSRRKMRRAIFCARSRPAMPSAF